MWCCVWIGVCVYLQPQLRPALGFWLPSFQWNIRTQVLLLSVHIVDLVLCVAERHCHALGVCTGKQTAGLILRHNTCANCLVRIRTFTFFVGCILDKKSVQRKVEKDSYFLHCTVLLLYRQRWSELASDEFVWETVFFEWFFMPTFEYSLLQQSRFK